MNVLLTGASGFIGRRLLDTLCARGHRVLAVARRVPAAGAAGVRWRELDFAAATGAAAWLPLLEGVDVVVNAAGLFRETRAARFEDVHERAPIALFEACRRAGVRRVVQVSALSDVAPGRSRFIDTKRAADAALRRLLPDRGVVVRPSLVFGPEGASSRMLLTLASLPVLVLPRSGAVQPVHVDDVAAALAALVEGAAAPGEGVALVGPQPMPLAGYLAVLAAAMGRRPPRVMALPSGPIRLAARLGLGRWLSTESLALLEAGAQADPGPTAALLGRPPRPPASFIADRERGDVRRRALLGWGLPLLRVSIALVWIVTGLLSFGLYPVDDSRALLAAVGIPAALQLPMLYGAAAFDLLLGVLTLAAPSRLLWRVQAALMLFYMAVIAVWLPQFWLHPFGPLLKNLPMLAGLAVLDAFEEPRRRRWTT